MLRIPAGPGCRAPARLRLLTLAGLAAVAVLLPLGAVSAGQTDAGGPDPSAGGASAGGTSGSAATAGRTAAAATPAAGTTVAGVPVVPAPAARTPAAVPSAPQAAVAGRERPGSLGLGQATAVRCGPELSAPDGVEAQTCVLTRGGETWARAYYRNTTGDTVDALLSLMGPGGRSVLTRCVAGGDDEPATCDTPRLRVRGVPAAYTAVAEFAGRGDAAPLMLRVGSNFPH
ncbi:hypothetical protein [Streptomyces sp. NPDC059597]|uniref:hypothetical protein n=1 Tax=Streptomyces sp. NPDC059597 TaxID=3346879 RepID=UPI0036AED99F